MKTQNVGIYVFVSLVSGFRYIGQSTNLRKRKYEHLRRLGNGSHICKHFQSHYAKHGAESLEYSVIEYCIDDMLTEREQYFMDLWRPSGLFNSAPAAGSTKGIVKSAETLKKLSLASIGRRQSKETRLKRSESIRINGNTGIGIPRSEETIKKMSAALTGRKQTPEAVQNRIDAKLRNGTTRLGIPRDAATRAKLSAANTGKVMSQETKQKISAALAGRKKSPEYIKNSADALRSRLSRT